MRRALLFVLGTFLLTGLGCKVEPKKNQERVEELYGSYEAKTDKCTTDRHVFSSDNEDKMFEDLCSALRNQSLNRNCAESERGALYASASCQGQWPFEKPSSSVLVTYYTFSTESCKTGVHFFSAPKQEDRTKIYCLALLDDELNHHCNRVAREDEFERLECTKYIE
ncbi:MAG: hypothetical protein KDD22_03805 [Bdellovibrionales bacterium]|nr:hypothetical protein [Bdellovibrionales bacterium]